MGGEGSELQNMESTWPRLQRGLCNVLLFFHLDSGWSEVGVRVDGE